MRHDDANCWRNKSTFGVVVGFAWSKLRFAIAINIQRSVLMRALWSQHVLCLWIRRLTIIFWRTTNVLLNTYLAVRIFDTIRYSSILFDTIFVNTTRNYPIRFDTTRYSFTNFRILNDCEVLGFGVQVWNFHYVDFVCHSYVLTWSKTQNIKVNRNIAYKSCIHRFIHKIYFCFIVVFLVFSAI